MHVHQDRNGAGNAAPQEVGAVPAVGGDKSPSAAQEPVWLRWDADRRLAHVTELVRTPTCLVAVLR